MDHPIFKLEKVVQPKTGETLEDFEGPLDLILFLLNKNKIEIQDIPIALILDQYLAYLEQRKQMMGAWADYLDQLRKGSEPVRAAVTTGSPQARLAEGGWAGAGAQAIA